MIRGRFIILSISFIFISSIFLINKGSHLTSFDFNAKSQTDSIPPKNKKIIEYVINHGPQISPTYEKAVCTELLIEVLQNFITLTKLDKKKIRIICDTNVYLLRLKGSLVPKGVHYALTTNGKGIAINKPEEVKPGDFVQFWNLTWGHCGIVKSINPEAKNMELYSSFPSTNGYGIQTFDIPAECYFVRLK